MTVDSGDVDAEADNDGIGSCCVGVAGGGGGCGVRNKGSVDKLLKLIAASVATAAAVVGDDNVGVITLFGSVVGDIVPVVCTGVLPHIEDNTKAAATVCS